MGLKSTQQNGEQEKWTSTSEVNQYVKLDFQLLSTPTQIYNIIEIAQEIKDCF